MAISKELDGVKHYKDSQWLYIPYNYVSQNNRKRDNAVKKIFTRVHRINNLIRKEKEEITKIVNDYLEGVAQEYNEKWKGNTTLYDFSNVQKIEISISERVDFNEKLQIAKSKIDKCINSWSKGGSQKVKLLIDRAFMVDKKGSISSKMLLGLRQLEIEDTLWQEAMNLISDSIIIIGSKVYYRFYEKAKKNQSKQWEAIEVNFSAI